MADGGGANGVAIARLYSTVHRRRLLIVSPAIFRGKSSRMWLCRSRERNGRESARHHRHVTGRVARRKAGRPPGHYPRFGLCVMPQQRGGIIIRESGRSPAGGGQHGGAALRTAPAGCRGSSGGQPGASRKTMTGAAKPGWHAFLKRGKPGLHAYFPAYELPVS